MSRINEFAISSRNVQSQQIEKNGNVTFRLQDKNVNENGIFMADAGYDGLGKVDVDVQGGGGGNNTAWLWKDVMNNTEIYFNIEFSDTIDIENIEYIDIMSNYLYTDTFLNYLQIPIDKVVVSQTKHDEFVLEITYEGREGEYTITRDFIRVLDNPYVEFTLW